MVDRKKEDRLNEIAQEWRLLSPENSAGRICKLREDLFLLAWELYDRDGTMSFPDAFGEALEKFDPERGPFSHYLAFLLSRRGKDVYRDVLGRTAQLDSLDEVLPGNEGRTREDLVPGAVREQPEELTAAGGVLDELTALILNFTSRHRGQANNERRRIWYRIFFTEDVTCALSICVPELLHERELFEAMKLPYLDYYMTAPCRTALALAMTARKPYGQTVPERTGETRETPLPIPADVSLSYLRLQEGVRAGASARSRQWSFYEEEKEALRTC